MATSAARPSFLTFVADQMQSAVLLQRLVCSNRLDMERTRGA